MAITYDESNAAITEQLCGRTIESVVRNGLILEFRTVCGHVVKLQADVNGDIHFRGTDVSIMLPDVTSMGISGFMGVGTK